MQGSIALEQPQAQELGCASAKRSLGVLRNDRGSDSAGWLAHGAVSARFSKRSYFYGLTEFRPHFPVGN
jgi:hypothetical protein